MWSIFQLLEDDCVLNVLDIGAALTSTPPYQKLVDANRARVVGFEPDSIECQRLNETFGAPHRFLPLFVGNGKEATYHQTHWGATGSLFEPNTPLLNKFADWAGYVTPLSQSRVLTTRLDDIDDLGDIDFIKIDVQGSELDIFRNAISVLKQALVIQTEVSFVEGYKRQPLFSEVDALLRANGFQYHMIEGFGARRFRSFPAEQATQFAFHQQLWADAIYVKDWMRLDLLSPEKLRKYAALLHDIASSYDLAHTVLVEHDRQTGQNLSQKYLQRFSPTTTGPQEWTGSPVQDAPVAHEGDGEPHESLTSSNEPQPSGIGNALVIETIGGNVFSVPADLTCISTYTLLEQERWFEIELDFLEKYLTKGMTAIDIGANVGLYTVPLAKAVEPGGRVIAYEPSTRNRRHLERNAQLNRVTNVRISPCALSNNEGSAHLSIAWSGELDSLTSRTSEPTESVTVTTLDAQLKSLEWMSADFIKIDAEGQEARIVAGGRAVFRELSPLVMYEVSDGNSDGESLRWTFEALGYDTYRLLGDASMLVPLRNGESHDASLLNLFAAKPDRARKLAESGLLVLARTAPALSESERTQALAGMLKQKFARAFEMALGDIAECPFGDAIIAYSGYRYVEGLAPERRYALLASAFDQLDEFCRSNASPAALVTFARIANDLGYRAAAAEALKRVATMTRIEIDQPFFPASPRFDSIDADDTPENWFKAAALEQLELSRAWSSQFLADISRLKWLCGSKYVSGGILRRMILGGMTFGLPRRDICVYLNMLQESQVLNRTIWLRSADELYSLLGV